MASEDRPPCETVWKSEYDQVTEELQKAKSRLQKYEDVLNRIYATRLSGNKEDYLKTPVWAGEALTDKI